MGCEVYANGDEIACKAGDGKVIAAFPDVCLTPPPPPAGPIPVPYPDTSFSKDMQNGSKTVQIKGQEVMLKDSSFYKTSPLGDEAATNGQGAGVVTHVITGKTYFVAWSMDVQFEGQNVDRHTDLTTSNHASPMANAAGPMMNAALMAQPTVARWVCECCNGPVHSAAQAYGEEIPEEDFYSGTDVTPGMPGPHAGDGRALRDLARRPENSNCAHLLPPDPPNPSDPCSKYYRINRRENQAARARFSEAGANPLSNPNSLPHVHGQGRMAHRVPLCAGGCPIGPGNLAPVGNDPNCQYLESISGEIQNTAANYAPGYMAVP